MAAENSSAPTMRDEAHAADLAQGVCALWAARALCDITIQAGTRTIHAHKVVLSALSQYFHAMFASGMQESRAPTITLEDVDGDASALLIEYLYTGQLHIARDNALAMLSVSMRLCVPGAERICCSFLESTLDAENALPILDVADRFSCTSLLHSARACVLSSFSKIYHSESWQALSQEQVVAILSHDSLMAERESMVFDAVLFWVAGDHEARYSALAQLLACVRLPLMSIEEVAVVLANPWVRASAECRTMLCEYEKRGLEGDVESGASKVMKRDGGANGIAHAGADAQEGGLVVADRVAEEARGEGNGDCEAFGHGAGGNRSQPLKNPSASVSCSSYSSPLSVLSSPSYGASMCSSPSTVSSFPSIVATASGSASDSAASSILPLSTTALLPSDPSPPLPKASFFSSRLRGRPTLFMIGGSSVDGIESDVMHFDVNSGLWSETALFLNRPTARHHAAAACTPSGTIYLFGGLDSSRRAVVAVEALDRHTKTWRTVAQAPPGMGLVGLQCAFMDDFMYITGGSQSEGRSCASAFRFNTLTHEWQQLPSMPTPRRFHAMAAHAGHLFVCGGRDRGASLRSVDCFHVAKRKWQELPPMCQARAYFSAAVVSDSVYVVGGENEASEQLSTGERLDTRPLVLPSQALPEVPMIRTTTLPLESSQHEEQQQQQQQQQQLQSTLCWQPIASMSIPRAFMAMVVYPPNTLYVVGGMQPDVQMQQGLGRLAPLASMAMYDAAADTWTVAASAPQGRSGACGVCLPIL